MKKLIVSLVACAFAFSVMAGENQCPAKKSCGDKAPSECPAKKGCDEKAKDGKGCCPAEKKDGKDQKK